MVGVHTHICPKPKVGLGLVVVEREIREDFRRVDAKILMCLKKGKFYLQRGK